MESASKMEGSHCLHRSDLSRVYRDLRAFVGSVYLNVVILRCFSARAISSVVERLLYTQDVGGSTPSSPTSLLGHHCVGLGHLQSGSGLA
jgi:hypothetical protein